MIDENTKKLVKTNFSAWLELNAEKKALSAQTTDLINSTAELTKMSKAAVRKFFGFWKKIHDGGEDELNEITELSMEMMGEKDEDNKE